MSSGPPDMEEKEFTVEEANALLPELTQDLRTIQEARQLVLAGAERIRRRAGRNGGGQPGRDYWDALGALRRGVESITGRGIVLRDAETGLVDFPTSRDGRQVFLCWRVGEDRVAFWHGPEGGFSGRRPL